MGDEWTLNVFEVLLSFLDTSVKTEMFTTGSSHTRVCGSTRSSSFPVHIYELLN